jgi:ATP-dependent Lon protease
VAVLLESHKDSPRGFCYHGSDTSMNPARIPLFPLDIVLFPGQAVPLHIFEPRYRQMTRHCIDSQSPFGIVHLKNEQLAQTGCSAMIVKILKEYEDGRSDILTAGQNAFRLVRTHDEKPYLEAEVEYLEEDFTEVNSAVSARLEELCDQCHQLLYGEDAPQFETEGGISLAYHVASELPVDVTIRQGLLEIRSEVVRQARLVEHLAEWYEQLQKREHVRGKAAGNGHAKL